MTKSPVPTTSTDPNAARIAELKQLFPEAFSEGKIDFDKLRATLGDHIDDGPERYSFTWAGKRDAIRLLQTPTSATLIPDREESINFDQTEHLFIEGDNLEVLKLLYKAYFGKVKMIYIDPPYNTGNDFVYPDNFADPLGPYLELTGQRDSEGNLLTSNTDTSGRFHSAWLNMMYPRLFLARQLLREDGFIVISIDDVELANLSIVLNELFGEENHVATLVFDRNRKNDAKYFSVGHEYMVVVAKNWGYLKELQTVLRAPKEGVEEVRDLFNQLRHTYSDDWTKVKKGLKDFFAELDKDDPRKPLGRYTKVDEKGPYRDDGDVSWPGSGGPTYQVLHPVTQQACKVPSRGWVYPKKERMLEAIKRGRVVFGDDHTTVPRIRKNLFEQTTKVMKSVHFSYAQTATRSFNALFDDQHVFDNPKHYADLKLLVDYLTDEDDLVVDFFAGSGSLGHAIYESNKQNESNRKFVLVQLPEPINDKSTTGKSASSFGFRTIAALTISRLKRVLSIINEEQKGKLGFTQADLGFRVFKLAPSHMTPWDGSESDQPDSLLSRMKTQTKDPLLPGWEPEAVVWEIAIKEGFPLTGRIDLVYPMGQAVYRVMERGGEEDRDRENGDSEGRFFHICLEDEVSEEIPRQLGLTPQDLFICRDLALTDTTAANLALACKLKTI